MHKELIAVCDICDNPYRRGIDSFVLENEQGVLVRNGSNFVHLKNSSREYMVRYSFAIHEHESNLSRKQINSIKKSLVCIFSDRLEFQRNQYIFHLTMNSIPDHWHIHICVLPYKLVCTLEGI